jgi:hypothetical protein
VNNAPTWDVLLADCNEVSTASVAEAISAFKKIPFQDAAHETRLAWGFLGSALVSAEADRFEEILHSKGLPTRRVTTGSLPTLPVPQTVKAIELEPTVIKMTLSTGAIATLEPKEVAILAAIGVPQRSVSVTKTIEGRTATEKIVSVGLLLSGIPIPIGKKKRVVEKTTIQEEMFFYGDIVTAAPHRRFRLDALALSYSFLNERMVHNTLLNFKTMLRDLAAWAPHARINKGMRYLMGNRILSQMGYETMADLDKETLWLTSI